MPGTTGGRRPRPNRLLNAVVKFPDNVQRARRRVGGQGGGGQRASPRAGLTLKSACVSGETATGRQTLRPETAVAKSVPVIAGHATRPPRADPRVFLFLCYGFRTCKVFRLSQGGAGIRHASRQRYRAASAFFAVEMAHRGPNRPPASFSPKPRASVLSTRCLGNASPSPPRGPERGGNRQAQGPVFVWRRIGHPARPPRSEPSDCAG